MTEKQELFVFALQALMRRHGVREIGSTYDGTVLVIFSDKTDLEFHVIGPDQKFKPWKQETGST